MAGLLSPNISGLLGDYLLAASAQDKFGYVPFDSTKHKPRDVGLGGPSTEYLATEYAPSGAAMNYPTIWWGPNGEPVLMDPSKAYEMSMAYEGLTGRTFPRFPDISSAETAAMHRSAQGGADVGLLAKLLRAR